MTTSPIRSVLPARFTDGAGRLHTAFVLLLAMLLVVGTVPVQADAATPPGASFTDGGTVVENVRYAKQGDQLTLEVVFTEAVRCVELSVDGTTTESGPKASSATWQFVVVGAAGDGPASVTATGKGTNNPGTNCTGQAVGGSHSATYERDNTAPTITGTPQTTNLGDNGWYTGDVAVAWSCTDDGSGLAPGACPADSAVEGEGDDLSVSVQADDRVGNTGEGTVTGIRIDRTPPLTTADAPVGWSASDLTVTLAANDSLSDVAATYYRLGSDEEWETYEGPLPFDDEGWYELEYRSVDRAGNVEDVKTAEFGIDKTSPTITTSQDPDANDAGWNDTDVTVSFECTDTVSGIANCTDDVTVTDEVKDHPVEGTAVDNAGNDNSATRLISIDKAAPVVTAHPPVATGEDGWYTAPVTITYTCDDPETNGVASGIPSGTCPTAQTLDQDGTGLSTTPVSVTDAAGNPSEAVTVGGIDIDQTDPVTTATGVPDSWINGPVTVTLEASDEGSGVATTHYQINHGEVQTGTVIELDTDGRYTLTYWSVDVAGNIEHVQEARVRIDTLPPVSDATLSTDEWTNQPVTVTITANDEAGGSGLAAIRYQLGDDEVQAYDEPFDVEDHGVQTLTYWSVDNAGNVEEHNTATIRIDTLAPTLTGQALGTNLGKNGWYTDDITVEWTCSDDDSGIDGDCPPDSTVTGEGSNLSASAYVYDNADNRTDTTVDGLKLDRTAPDTTASIDPEANEAGWQNADVTVALTATDELSGVASTSYRIDGGGWQTSDHVPGASIEVPFTEDGEYTIEFRSEDIAGNLEEVNQVEVKVDQTAPTITSSQDPEKNEHRWNNTKVTVSFECDDDGPSGIASCTGDVELDEEGKHEVDGQAIDNAGNSADTTHKVRIDTTPPQIDSTVTGELSDSGWYTSPVTVGFTCTDPVSNGVASGIPADTCPESQTLSQDGEDLATSPVTVDDKAGNVSAPHTAGGIDIDQTAPETDADGVREGWTNQLVTVTLSATDAGSGVASTHYRIGDGDDETYNPDEPLEFSAQGSYTLTYWSVDVAGNSETPRSAAIQIDTTAPTTSSSGVPPTDWVNSPVEVTLVAADAGGSGVASTYFRIGDGTDTVYSDPISITEEGVHTLAYWSVDAAGNVEDEQTATIRIDRTDPETSSDAPSGWQTEPVTVELTATDTGGSGLDATYYKLGDEGTTKTYDEPFELGEGVHDLRFWSEDKAGNVEDENTATIQIDLTDPLLTITAPTNNSSTNATTTTVTGTASDAVSGLADLTVNDTPVDVVEEAFELSGVELVCGPNTITVVATDKAGQTTTREVAVTRRCAAVTDIDKPLHASKQGAVRINELRGNRVVPVKVELEYLDEAYTGTDSPLGNPTITVRELNSCAALEELETAEVASPGQANDGDQFRPSAEGWIYNLSSGSLKTATCYRVDVHLDGVRATNDQWIVLRRQ